MTANVEKKIIVLGESEVGKTALVRRFCKGIFKKYSATSVDHLTKQVSVKGRVINLKIWDTGGDERFRSIVKSFYREAQGVLLVYDVNDLHSFQMLSTWLKELREFNETAIVILVGNKNENDDDDSKAVTRKAIRKYAREESLDYIETSAMNNNNVNEAFELLASKILEEELQEEETELDVIRLEEVQQPRSSVFNFFRLSGNNSEILPPIESLDISITPLITKLPRHERLCLLA